MATAIVDVLTAYQLVYRRGQRRDASLSEHVDWGFLVFVFRNSENKNNDSTRGKEDVNEVEK